MMCFSEPKTAQMIYRHRTKPNESNENDGEQRPSKALLLHSTPNQKQPSRIGQSHNEENRERAQKPNQSVAFTTNIFATQIGLKPSP